MSVRRPGGKQQIPRPDVFTEHDEPPWDIDATWTVDGNQFRSRCNSSPLDGVTLEGKVTHTIVDGTIRFEGSEAVRQ